MEINVWQITIEEFWTILAQNRDFNIGKFGYFNYNREFWALELDGYKYYGFASQTDALNPKWHKKID